MFLVLPPALSLNTCLTCLELGDHVLLRIVGHRLVQQQSFGQVLLVVTLKDVFLLQEPEQHHGLVKDVFDFSFRHLRKEEAKVLRIRKTILEEGHGLILVLRESRTRHDKGEHIDVNWYKTL